MADIRRGGVRPCTHETGRVIQRRLRPLCPYSEQVRAAAQFVAMGQKRKLRADRIRERVGRWLRVKPRTVDQRALLKQARAVTLLAAVIARLAPFIGIKWVSGSNSMEAKSFINLTENIGQPDMNAVPLWVRIMHYNQPDGAIGGTLGLHYFGFADLEYAAGSLDLTTVMSHAYSTSETLLRSGQPLPEDTIKVEGQSNVFKVSYKEEGGIFVPHAVAYISPSSGKKSWWKW